MRGVPGFRHPFGMRQVPRPGHPGGSRGCASMPELQEGRSRPGPGPAGTLGCKRFGRGVTVVPRLVKARTLSGWEYPARECSAPRPAARSFRAPPRRRHKVRRPAARHWGAARRSCRRSADNGLSVPSRDAGKAAASSRCALPPRRASVVTTAEPARLGSDDAVRLRTCNPETRAVRGFSRWGDGGPE